MTDLPKLAHIGESIRSNSQGAILIPKIDIEKQGISKDVSKIQRKIRFNFLKKRWIKLAAAVLGAVVFLTIALGLLLLRIYKDVVSLTVSAQNLAVGVNEQDLDKVERELQEVKVHTEKLKKSFGRALFLKYIPFAGVYVSDFEHAMRAGSLGIESAEIVLSAVKPYADIIGFSKDSQNPGSPEETTKDRLDFVVKSLPDLISKTAKLPDKVATIQKEINFIDPERYPQTLFGKKIKENVEKGKELINLSANFVVKGRPLLEKAPYLFGIDAERKYLVIFQNDKELRPTGGFITAYSLAKVNKGKFEPVLSSDIYNLDATYKPHIKASDPIIKYIKGPYVLSPYFKLRDLNWSPDFSKSMDLFTKEIESVGLKDIDGIIAVDTQLLVNLLQVIGPVGVPGYGNFSTEIVPECKCPQVIYELESFADVEGPVVWSQDEPGKIIFAPPNYENRKKIIGPLMNSILANILGQTKEKIPALFEAALKSLDEKHILFYVHNAEAQDAVEKFGIGGNIREYDGDFFHVNDANLGGRKSNLYVKQEVHQEITIEKDGNIMKVVTITYQNPEKHDGWLNSVLPNWVRIYVPKGSELMDFDGVGEKVDPYEELGKTVFAGFFSLRPQGVAKLTLRYKLPFKAGMEYKILVQKQPGTDNPLYSIKLGKKQEELFLRTDKELKFKI